MKLVTISRGKLELARVHLSNPVITIGRSPTCDVILRAPGVQPMHFLIEWIGAGEFDPTQDTWSVADISQPMKLGEDSSGEGAILSEDSVTVAGFIFRKV